MRTATIMLTTVLLLGSASLAVAHDTAWVLWEQRSSQTTDRHTGDKTTSLHNYYTEDAFTSHEACASARDKAFGHSALVVRESPGNKEFRQNRDKASFTYTEENTAYVLKYLCLPATLDPRERKE